MLCTNCGKRIKKTLIKCPYCGERVINKDNFSMPQLKDEEKIIEIIPGDFDLSDNTYEIELKDTNYDSDEFDKFEGIDLEKQERTIDEDLLIGETKQLCFEDMGSLMDDIKDQIENMADNVVESIDLDSFVSEMEEKEISVEEIEENLEELKNDNEKKQEEIKPVEIKKEKVNNKNKKQNKKNKQRKEKIEKLEQEEKEIIEEQEEKKEINKIPQKEEPVREIKNEEIKKVAAIKKKAPQKLVTKKEEKIEEKKENIEKNIEPTIIEKIEDKYKIENYASVKKRRKIFIITVISMTILLMVGYGFYQFYIKLDHNNTKEYIQESNKLQQEIEEKMEYYYETEELDGLINYLTEQNNNGNLNDSLNIVVRICEQWVTSYYETEMNTKDELEIASTKVKEKISKLYTYGEIETNNGNIKIITKEKYEDLLKEINEISNEGALFFEALDLYNSRDYNKAYTALDSVSTSNRYYNKAKNLKNKIEENILDILKGDIEKLSKNIDELSDKDKFTRYIQIQEIIFEYKTIYYSVDLEHNNEYKEILEEYSTYVDKYSEI